MLINQKSHYALHALVELAKRWGQGPTKISDISQAQYIPQPFLEVILNQLKKTGIVESKRGYHGGYTLTQTPGSITVGTVLRFLERTANPDQCMVCISKAKCLYNGKCTFLPMWNKVQSAVYAIYDQTTINDLLTFEEQNCKDIYGNTAITAANE